MISATDVEIHVGSRVLLEKVSFRIAAGDRVGLVGRNGAGKTTLTKVLAGEALPAHGAITRNGEVGYLPQDPRTGDLDVLARDQRVGIGGEQIGRHLDLAWSVEPAHGHPAQHQRCARASSEILGLLPEQPHHLRADRSAPQHGHPELPLVALHY